MAKPKVLATMSILADVARQIGAPDLEISSLIGPDQSAHHRDPTPNELTGFADVSLLLHVGFKLEGWIDRLPESTGYRGSIIQASNGIEPILIEGRIPDPHTWQSFVGLRRYAQTIANAYIELWPNLTTNFESRLKAYLAEIKAAEQEAQALLAPVRQGRGLIIVPHNSFRYLGREFGLEFRGISSLSTGAQPSAKALADLLDEIKGADAAACFIETEADQRLMGQIAAESGAKLGGKLYSDSLSKPEGPAGTSIRMLAYNVATIAKALTA
jgi:zinc/manganese transport system substrate-binding protein